MRLGVAPGPELFPLGKTRRSVASDAALARRRSADYLSYFATVERPPERCCNAPIPAFLTHPRSRAARRAGSQANGDDVAVNHQQSEAATRGARMLRTALGPAVTRFLEDPAIVEVMLNPDGRLWVDRLSDGLSDTGERLSAAVGLLRFLNAWPRNTVSVAVIFPLRAPRARFLGP